MLKFLTRPSRLSFTNVKQYYLYHIRFISENNSSQPKKHFNPFKKKKFRSSLSSENELQFSNRICLTVIGNGAVGQPRCVGLFTEFKSYLFNCGEGVGRYCREYDIDMLKIKHIFITQKEWKNLSGIPDVYLTNREFRIRKMTVHGPSGIGNFKYLLSSQEMDVTLSEKSFPEYSSYEDVTLKIEYVPIKSHLFNKKKDTTTLKGCEDVSYSYICKIFDQPGTLLPEKCIEYGVPIGPELLKLRNGENITLPSGKVVYSADVCDASPGMVFLVVDCPSEYFLDAFINEKKFDDYILPVDSSLSVSIIFHFTPPHIMSSQKYLNWMNKFPQTTHHIILNNDSPNISSEAVHSSQEVLHLLHPRIFNLLQEKVNSSGTYSHFPGFVTQAPPMLQIHHRPIKKIIWSNAASPIGGTCIEDVKNLPGFSDILKDLQLAETQNFLSKNTSGKYPEVLFLGTSSSTSSAFRNVSAILVSTSPYRSILLDCGEGTLMQLTRHFGCSDVNSVLRNISCVFISHKHTDHYLGLFEFIKARMEAFEISGNTYKELLLILPLAIEDIFKRFCDVFENLMPAVRTFPCRWFREGRNNIPDIKPFVGNIRVETVPVKHCSDAHGVVLHLDSDVKIVYSGDTAPCQKLIDAGKNCTLLIHEATIEDDFVNEATARKHSTPVQVTEIAEMMNAKHTIMTHFSKRYLAVPVFKEYSHRNVGCAFDFMKVRLDDLPLVPLFLPAMKLLFQEQLDSFKERTAHVVNFENVFMKILKS